MVVYTPHSLNHIIFKNNYKKICLFQLIVVSLYLKLYNKRIMLYELTGNEGEREMDEIFNQIFYDYMNYGLVSVIQTIKLD